MRLKFKNNNQECPWTKKINLAPISADLMYPFELMINCMQCLLFYANYGNRNEVYPSVIIKVMRIKSYIMGR